jgi:hypothetical protein
MVLRRHSSSLDSMVDVISLTSYIYGSSKAFQFVRFHGGRDGMIPFPLITFDCVWFFEGIPVP